MFDIISFGSAVVDVFAGTDIPEKKKCIAYPVGSKILIKDLKFDIGGGGTNTAVAFSRLGLKTGFIGKIGDDKQGQEILNLLKKEKIKFLGKIESRANSGYSIILDSREKNRTILTYKGINNEFRFSELNLRKIKTRWLYLSSLLGESFKTQKKLAGILHKKGVKIAYNPSEYIIRKYRKKKLSEILKLCDVLILNKDEAKLLVLEKDLLKGLRNLGAKIVVITDKNKLISCFDGEKKYYLKPHKIKVVERTGAGDAFASGFVAGQVAEKNIMESLKLGLSESESVIKYFGAKNKLLRLKLR